MRRIPAIVSKHGFDKRVAASAKKEISEQCSPRGGTDRADHSDVDQRLLPKFPLDAKEIRRTQKHGLQNHDLFVKRGDRKQRADYERGTKINSFSSCARENHESRREQHVQENFRVRLIPFDREVARSERPEGCRDQAGKWAAPAGRTGKVTRDQSRD